MNKIVDLIELNELSIEELAKADYLVKRAELVKEGLEACKKTISFPLGVKKQECYHEKFRTDYEAWAIVENDGSITFYNNNSTNQIAGSTNLTSEKEVFMAFENKDIARDLEHFLQIQIMQVNQ